jgi:hypothetical protein
MMFGETVRALVPILLMTRQALDPIEANAWHVATALSIWARASLMGKIPIRIRPRSPVEYAVNRRLGDQVEALTSAGVVQSARGCRGSPTPAADAVLSLFSSAYKVSDDCGCPESSLGILKDTHFRNSDKDR